MIASLAWGVRGKKADDVLIYAVCLIVMRTGSARVDGTLLRVQFPRRVHICTHRRTSLSMVPPPWPMNLLRRSVERSHTPARLSRWPTGGPEPPSGTCDWETLPFRGDTAPVLCCRLLRQHREIGWDSVCGRLSPLSQSPGFHRR